MRLLILMLFLAPISLFAQSDYTAVTAAVGKGDLKAVSQFLDSNVEISLMDKEDIYSKEKATKILELFFSQNKPKSFKEVHKGTSRGNDSQYCIGNLSTSTKTFRVYIYMKSTGGKVAIKELRFDEE